jgi:hypothetical protein
LHTPAQEGGNVNERLIKRFAEELGAAIKDSITESEQIPELIAKMEGNGYDVLLVLNATIAIKERDTELMALPARTNGMVESRFSRQDVQFLKSMHISVNG